MPVKISTNKTSPQIETIHIAIEKNDYMPQVETAIKEYGKKVSIKGFRPGKVPANMLKNMVGNQVLAEQLDKILNEELRKYISENNIHFLGDPLPVPDENLHFDIAHPIDLEFQYELGLAPEFSLDVVNPSVVVKKYAVIVDDAVVNREIEAMQKRFGNRDTATDNIKEGDIVKVDLVEINFSGAEIENGVKTSTVLSFDLLKGDKVKDDLKQHKVGSVIKVDDIYALFDRTREQVEKHILDIREPLDREMSPAFNMTVTEVTRLSPHELNQDFYNKIYGEGKINSEEEFRKKVTDEVTEFFNRQSEMKLDLDIRDKVLETVDFQLPDTFLKKWIQATNEKDITGDQIEAEYGAFAKNLKWQLIVNKISEANNLKVEEDELVKHTTERIKRSYGLTDMDMEMPQMRDIALNVLKDKEQSRKAHETILQEKVFAYLKTVVSTETENVTLEKFNELA